MGCTLITNLQVAEYAGTLATDPLVGADVRDAWLEEVDVNEKSRKDSGKVTRGTTFSQLALTYFTYLPPETSQSEECGNR